MTALITPPVKTRRRVVGAVAAITVGAWAYLLFLSMRMSEMHSPFAMPMTSAWTGHDLLLMWTMWAVMMAAMMLPSASPMISAYAKTVRGDTAGFEGSTPSFVTGYLIAWSGFAVLATGAQWFLHDATLVTAMGVSTSRWLGGVILLGAGIYQFTGIKDACLAQCRTPLGFILNEWRPGSRGALIMGLRHGTFCIGCCWALMAILFVLGVMNLWWIAVVAAVVLAEKIVPSRALTHMLGAGLSVWGIALLAGLGA